MEENKLTAKTELVVIGGSTGSLGVIISIMRHLRNVTYAIIVVLHRKSTADSILADLLSSHSAINVKEAEEKELIVPGRAYLAPPDYHLLIESDRTISLDASEKVNFSRPSIDVTFESAAEVYGAGAAGLLLSGGNNDGAEGLKKIHERGGLCIVQDPLSAEVPFMPEFALSQLQPHQILHKNDIPGFLSLL
jgi:two-component system chemotaxis response regulator CheB